MSIWLLAVLYGRALHSPSVHKASLVLSSEKICEKSLFLLFNDGTTGGTVNLTVAW
jgi:hypothetical protein